MQAARKVSAANTAEARLEFSKQLALVFRTNEFFAAKVHEKLLSIRENRSAQKEDFRDRHQTPPKVLTPEKEYSAEQITCQVCGVQDETLRLVSYPFVFSIVIVTFRRMFQGVYCSRHANRYFFLAAFITISVGWLGIPFGLIFTPITLFNLFISDKQLRSANAKMLLEIAKEKQDKDKRREAAVFFQEALWLEDSGSIKNPANQASAALWAAPEPSYLFRIFSLVGGLVTAWLMGFLIGLVDGMISNPFTDLQGQVSFLVIIFSYLPLLLMLYFGSFLLARVIRWMLQQAIILNPLAGRGLAATAALIAFYAVLTGNLFFFVQLGADHTNGGLFNTILVNGLLLIHGGWLTFVGIVQQGTISDFVFVVLVMLGLMLFLGLGQDWANRTVSGQRAMAEMSRREEQDLSGWIGLCAILVVLSVFVILGLIFFPAEILVN
jgi:hypothetical protein